MADTVHLVQIQQTKCWVCRGVDAKGGVHWSGAHYAVAHMIREYGGEHGDDHRDEYWLIPESPLESRWIHSENVTFFQPEYTPYG